MVGWTTVEAETPYKAYFALLEWMFECPEEFYNTNSHLHSLPNVVVQVENPAACDLSLALGHFTQKRWDKFLSEYTDEHFPQFMRDCLKLRASSELGYSPPVIANHTHGNCLMAVTVGGNPLEVTLFSRTSLIYPTGILDLAFGAAIAEWLQVQKIQQTPIVLNWVIRSAVIHAKKMIPFFEQQELYKMDLWRVLEEQNKLCDALWLWHEKLQADPDCFINSKFGPVQSAGKKLKRIQAGETWPDIYPHLEI